MLFSLLSANVLKNRGLSVKAIAVRRSQTTQQGQPRAGPSSPSPRTFHARKHKIAASEGLLRVRSTERRGPRLPSPVSAIWLGLGDSWDRRFISSPRAVVCLGIYDTLLHDMCLTKSLPPIEGLDPERAQEDPWTISRL